MNRFSSDIFVEYMVKKKISGKDIGMIVGSIVGAIVILLAAMLILPTYAGTSSGQIVFFMFAAACYGIYYLCTTLNLEFEYSFTNGDLTIDKIMGRKNRKRLTSFDAKDIEEMGMYKGNEAKLKGKNVEKTIFAGRFADGRDSMYIIAASKKTGRTLLVFDPSEKIIDGMKFFVPREVRTSYYGR